MELTNEEFACANKSATEMQARYPRATSVRYDRRNAKLVVELESGLGLMMSLKDVQGLQDVQPADLEQWEISPSGFGIYFPRIDVDLYVPGLLEGYLGSRNWMAAKNGRVGGKVSSAAKAAAAKENGRLGGRPRKAKPKESSAA